MKKTKPTFNEKLFIELCTKREMIMYNLRQQGVPFSQRLREVLPISVQISAMNLGEEKAEIFERKYIELHEQKEKAEKDGDKEKVNKLFDSLCYLCISQDNIDVEPKIGTIFPVYEIKSATRINGVLNPHINGKEIYKRILIKKVGERKYIGDGKFIADVDLEYLNNKIKGNKIWL